MKTLNLFSEVSQPKGRGASSPMAAVEQAHENGGGDHVGDAVPEKATTVADHVVAGPDAAIADLVDTSEIFITASENGGSGADGNADRDNKLRALVPDTAPQSVPHAEVGAQFMIAFGSLSVAEDNPWGRDVVEDEAFRRVLAAVPVPADLEPMLVVRSGNGWSIVGDPAALIAVAHLHEGEQLAAIELPVREMTGSKAAIVLHTARQALGGRAFKNMRRARLALRICETDGLNGKAVAAQLGLHGSGTTRDLKAARMEREHPMLAQILASPSEAPVSYYTDLREYADMQPSPGKAMVTLIAAAAKLVKAGRTFTATEAKAALGVTKPSARAALPVAGTTLKTSGYLEGAVLERTAKGATRLIVSLPADLMPDDKRVAALEVWLAAAGPLFQNPS